MPFDHEKLDVYAVDRVVAMLVALAKKLQNDR